MRQAHELMAKFRVDALGLREYEHWIVAVREKQVTLGASVILLKRPEPSVGALTKEEAGEFPEAASWFEERVGQLWKPDRYNYIAAMMNDPFVHFHAIPRYETPREFNGQTYRDHSWPGLIEFVDVDTPPRHLSAICATMNE